MRIRHFGLAVVLLMVVGQILVPTQARADLPAVHLAAAGDFDDEVATGTVLDGMAAQRPDAVLTLGDMSYAAPGTESDWCTFVRSHIGQVPFELLAGNHEDSPANGSDNGLIDNFAKCLPHAAAMPAAVGTYGKEYYYDYPADRPLVRVVMISPGLTYGTTKWSYTKGDAHYTWTEKAIDGARAKGVPWVIVGAHTPCLSMGNYSCTANKDSPGRDITNLLLAKRVDLVLHGHEHFYQRTKQLRNNVTGCSTLRTDGYDGDCVADADSSLTKGAGTVFATVGTGGTPLRNVYSTADAERSYFVTSSAANKTPTHGFLDLQVTSNTLGARFMGTNGSFSDAFTINRDRYVADEFSRTVADGWGSAPVGGAYALSSDQADYHVTGLEGTIVTEPGQHRQARPSLTRYYTDLRLTLALDAMPGGSGYYLRSDHRVSSTNKYYAGRVKVGPDGTVYAAISRNGTYLKAYTAVPGLIYRAGDRLNVRVLVQSRNATKLRVKVWPQGTPEPAGWAVSASDSTSGYQTGGGWRLDSYLSSGATSPVTVSFDDLVLERA